MIEVKHGEQITLDIRDDEIDVHVVASGEVIGFTHAHEEFADGSVHDLLGIRILTRKPTKATIEERIAAIERWMAERQCESSIEPSPIGE